MNGLAGKCSLITGASSGIGAATARRFAAEGARLFLTGLDGDAGAVLAGEITAAGGTAHFLAGDLADAAFRDSLVGEAVARLGRLDVLVNNAGLIRRGTAPDMSTEDWTLVMAVNLDAVFFLCRDAIPVMKRQGGGSIVNTASELAFTAARHAAAYCASKGGVLQLTRAMAVDHARDGIRINAICPGPVDSAMLRGGRDDGSLAAIAEEIPMGRLGRPDEIAAAIAFLASDDASFMTGAALLADGGVTAA
jgi:NAD(P)-dependent dehydrogenase (short-subunit alcohol dehydrogenase family)